MNEDMKSKITEIAFSEKETWNCIVKSFADFDVFYLNEYVAAFFAESPKNGLPLLLYYENGNDRAINVVFQRDIALDEKMKGKIETGQYYDLISPYGYGGFWGEISDFDELNKAYNEFCVSRRYVCEFVRFELFGEYRKHYDGEIETRTYNVVRSLSMSIDDMWMDFKPKVRKNVKKASSCGLEIIIENTDEHLRDFLDIYYSTMDRSNAEKEYYFSRSFFEILSGMKNNIMYFHAVYQGKIVSTEMVIFGAENGYSFLGGTDKNHFDLRPNDFLKFEVIKWAKERGLRNFVLGGGYGSNDGIFQYKACFAPNGIVNFYIGRKIFDDENYRKLVTIRAEENPDCRNSQYFPKYRA